MDVSSIENRIREAFQGCDVMVTDLTGSGSNFEVRVAATQFEGLNRVKQHQAIMGVFANELKSGEVHALSIQTIVK